MNNNWKYEFARMIHNFKYPISNKSIRDEIRREVIKSANKNISNQSYEERGQIIGYAAAKTPRLRGKQLLSGFYNKSVVTFQNNSIYIGISKSYYRYHHYGTRYLDVRKVISFSRKLGQTISNILIQ